MTSQEREAIARQIAKIRAELEALERLVNAAIEPDRARGISEARMRTRIELAEAPNLYRRHKP